MSPEIRKDRNDALDAAADICRKQGAIHREFGETTWAALAESYAEMILALKDTL